jgi:hypothetical protein
MIGARNPWNLEYVKSSDLIADSFGNGWPSSPDRDLPIVNLGDSTGSPGTIDLASKWFDLCTQHHQNTCGQDNELGPPLLPSRVIDIGNGTSNTVFLREPPADQRDRYICLSYCWGRSNFAKSTTATIRRHMTQGIAVTDLPRAFQDVIKIVHAFRVRYLWIDSLCIIQDSTADWEKESGRMAEVYSNSFLTIAATRAANPDESCFGTRLGPTVDSGHARHARCFPYTRSAEATPSFPLLHRGWAYQERILAPRVLHFGPDQVVWECRESRQCEFGSTGYYRDEVDKGEFFRRITAAPSANHQRQIQALWRHIVVQYTNFDLTVSSDIFPALSGLAERMWSSRQGEDYLAGLWSGSLIEDLLWHRDDSDIYRPLEFIGAEEWTWRAPTWSWASVYGPVLYSRGLYLDIAPPLLISSYAQLIKAECTPAGASRTGQITSGQITLQCPILKMPTDSSIISIFWVDNGDADSIGDDIYLGRIAKIGADGWEYSLALRAVNLQDRKFMRIGLVELERTKQPPLAWPRETTVITVL